MTRLRSRRVDARQYAGRLLALTGLVVVAAVTGGAGSAFGATASTQYDAFPVNSPDPGVNSRFAERLTAAGDLTGDGVPDIFASSYVQNVGGVAEAGRVVLLNGATREVVYKLTSPEVQATAHFGFYISVVGDVNKDGSDDLAVGTDAQDVGGNVNQGKLYVFDGPTGRLLYGIDNPRPQAEARFGSRIGSAGDVTGDGRADIITSAIANDVPAGCGNLTPVPLDCRKNQGQAFIFDGSNGSMVREINIPDADLPPTSCSTTGDCGNLGYAPQVLGDVNGDGVPDHMVPAGSLRPTPDRHGRIYVFDGKTGGVLTRIDQPDPDATSFFGLQDTDRLTPGDLNADGVPEIYGTGFLQDGPAGPSAGRGWVFDGKASLQAGKGVLLYEIKDPAPAVGKAFGFTQSRTDYNKDGRGDLYISNLQGQNTTTSIFDGRDGSVLKTLALPASEVQTNQPGNSGSALGWSSRAPGDLNGDGEPDYVAAAPFQDVNGNQDQGKVYFFLSNVPRQNVPGGGGYPLPPGGGGIPPKATVCPNSAGVKVIGQTNSGGRVIQGTNGNDRICGTSAGDLITGNGGKDVISGGGGNDRINGGSGIDRINGGSGKDLISGGSGKDSISGGTGNDRINGNSGNDRINGNSGNDRLNGSTGSDVVSGSSGKDVISGSFGNDRLSGNSGNDRINGNSGNDRISGGSGNDRLKGGSGNDRIDGGPGKDRISGGSGKDRTKQ